MTEALKVLEDGDWLRMVHRREPIPLYTILAEIGYQHRTLRINADRFEVLIWKRDDSESSAFCETSGDSSGWHP